MKTINTDLFGNQYLDTGRRARTQAGQPSLWEAQAKPKLDTERRIVIETDSKEPIKSYDFFDERGRENENL